MNKNFPIRCPSCSSGLTATRFVCEACQTSVEGAFDLPVLARLTAAEQELVLELIKSSGSLKDLAAHYRVSYPTIRNRVDELIARVNSLESETEKESQE